MMTTSGENLSWSSIAHSSSRPPWASSREVEQKHKQILQEVGESVQGCRYLRRYLA